MVGCSVPRSRSVACSVGVVPILSWDIQMRENYNNRSCVVANGIF